MLGIHSVNLVRGLRVFCTNQLSLSVWTSCKPPAPFPDSAHPLEKVLTPYPTPTKRTKSVSPPLRNYLRFVMRWDLYRTEFPASLGPESQGWVLMHFKVSCIAQGHGPCSRTFMKWTTFERHIMFCLSVRAWETESHLCVPPSMADFRGRFFVFNFCAIFFLNNKVKKSEKRKWKKTRSWKVEIWELSWKVEIWKIEIWARMPRY